MALRARKDFDSRETGPRSEDIDAFSPNGREGTIVFTQFRLFL